MTNNKVFVLLPEGISLRNFVFNNFNALAIDYGLDVVYWNRTSYDLTRLGLKEIRITDAGLNPLTDILKKARKQIELNLNIKKFNDTVYDSYRFPYSYKDAIATVKSLSIRIITKLFSSNKGLTSVRKYIIANERKTRMYANYLQTLRDEKPAILFSTSQRDVNSIAPMLAAKDLGIPTATFIFSWDNVPKATLVVEPDYYFVWSDYMKNELTTYYPYINPEKIIVTGTPQFEAHFDSSIIIPKADFFKKHELDPDKKYICYSGDDITTSPNDPLYLRDLAASVRELNEKGQNLGIIFRRCPVDFSKRFDTVLQNNIDIITPIEPQWERIGRTWSTVMPTNVDINLQLNTIAHTEMVVNLGSSMVFDYVMFDKPCAYINYDYPVSNKIRKNWSVKRTYNFVHFRSMPSDDAVLWINSVASIEEIILKGLQNNEHVLKYTKKWFEKINCHPAKDASARILAGIKTIIINSSSVK